MCFYQETVFCDHVSRTFTGFYIPVNSPQDYEFKTSFFSKDKRERGSLI